MERMLFGFTEEIEEMTEVPIRRRQNRCAPGRWRFSWQEMPGILAYGTQSPPLEIRFAALRQKISKRAGTLMYVTAGFVLS